MGIQSTGIAPPTNNLIEGNLIGTAAGGLTALANGQNGIALSATSDNTVGGTVSAARNVISGNVLAGVADGAAVTPESMGNVIEGNFIGTDETGKKALGNQGFGVLIDGATQDTVGGTTRGSENVISGNALGGVLLNGTMAATTANLIAGNFIGTDSSGSLALGKQGDGVFILNASGNTVGGTSTAARNVISGNGGPGVLVSSNGSTPASGNLIAGNFIGTDLTGTADLGNLGSGVEILNASGNTVPSAYDERSGGRTSSRAIPVMASRSPATAPRPRRAT